MKIEGETALVAGGCSLLGEAIVRQLVSLGAKVVFLDINASAGKSLEGELGSTSSLFLEVDVSKEE